MLTYESSGHKPRAIESLVMLKEMMTAAEGALSIMPGSGVNPQTAAEIIRQLPGLRDLHMSGGAWKPGVSEYRPTGFGMGVDGHEWEVWETSADNVAKVLGIAQESYEE